MKRKVSKTNISVFFSIRLWLEFLLSLCQFAAIAIRVCIERLCTIPLFIYRLFWCVQQGICVVGASHKRTPGVVLVGDAHKSLTHHKQQIFLHRIEEAVSLKSLPLKIGPDIDLVCPTSSFFTNTVLESSWMGAIWRPCRTRRGEAKLLCATLCACRLFWHPAFTKTHCLTHRQRFEVQWNLGFDH